MEHEKISNFKVKDFALGACRDLTLEEKTLLSLVNEDDRANFEAGHGRGGFVDLEFFSFCVRKTEDEVSKMLQGLRDRGYLEDIHQSAGIRLGVVLPKKEMERGMKSIADYLKIPEWQID